MIRHIYALDCVYLCGEIIILDQKNVQSIGNKDEVAATYVIIGIFFYGKFVVLERAVTYRH